MLRYLFRISPASFRYDVDSKFAGNPKYAETAGVVQAWKNADVRINVSFARILNPIPNLSAEFV
jgi:hypothetical protein